jgi:hypothetical protein
MRGALSRALMALAARSMGEGRRDWAAAMQAEYDAVDKADALHFAAGCFVAAWRDLLRREEGHLVLASYGLALGLMIPMATIQIGSALLGLPYLHSGAGGVPLGLVNDGMHEGLMQTASQGGVPSFTILLLVMGVGHLRLAWALLDRDWVRGLRVAIAMAAALMTLVLVMSAFFLDSSRVLQQGGVLAIELATVAMVARWHARLRPVMAEHPG